MPQRVKLSTYHLSLSKIVQITTGTTFVLASLRPLITSKCACSTSAWPSTPPPEPHWSLQHACPANVVDAPGAAEHGSHTGGWYDTLCPAPPGHHWIHQGSDLSLGVTLQNSRCYKITLETQTSACQHMTH